ncbi:MAG: hypothetical protein LBM60_07675 [Clostridium sp.]|jgi:hypothetical protein|nr:hypothetical protein [Clostridium sp.]
MGFWRKAWNRLFRKQVNSEEQESRDESLAIYARERTNFRDSEQRLKYFEDCYDQLSVATQQIQSLTAEYTLITSYLSDTEEVEALPADEKEALDLIARKIDGYDRERKDYRAKKNRMAESQYQKLLQQESEIEEGIRKMKEAESYRRLVRQDMQRLDAERNAYEYRQKELETIQANVRGISVIVLTALVICVLILFVLQFGLQMNTFWGYLIAVGAAATAIMIYTLKFKNAQVDLAKVEKAINRLILLQNKVKIRYANNTNLIEYLYMKYGTEHSSKLEKVWHAFLLEKEERRQFAEADAKVSYYEKELIERLHKHRVQNPQRWIHQVSAILDPKEMVEVRHELIIQRQALRKQLDYNKQVDKLAREEFAAITQRYPEYAPEIQRLLRGLPQRAQHA